MEQINFSNKRLVSDTGEAKAYLINVNGTDVRVYESTKTNRFGFNMKDLAKAFNYETVEELQASEQWEEFSTQISENLKKNTGAEEGVKIGKVFDVIGDAPTASTLSAKSANATSVWKGWAGLNGAITSPSDVFFWGGGDLDEAVEGKCPITFFADGSGWVANRNISWDALGNLLVRGVFESNNDGNRIIIDPITRSLKMIDAENKEIFNLSFATQTSGGVEYVVPKMVMNHWVGGEIVYWYEMTGYECRFFDKEGNQAYINPTDIGAFNQDRSWGFGFGFDGLMNCLSLSATNLPTSASGLLPGRIWRDGTLLRIVP